MEGTVTLGLRCDRALPRSGRPERWHDFGVCADILRSAEVPVLGVCLGHQGLGHVLKATVTYAPTVMHGRLSKVRHTGEGLFAGIPQDFKVVRYHSLAVTGSLGDEGREIAWTEDGVVMGIEHATRPMWGVQFHPESISTEQGHKLVENFYALAAEHKPPRRRRLNRPSVPPRRCRKRASSGSPPTLRVRSFEGQAPTEPLFEALFGECEHAFWLDSGGAPTDSRSAPTWGPRAARIGGVEYDVEQGAVIRRRCEGTLRRMGRSSGTRPRTGRAWLEPPESPPRGLIGGSSAIRVISGRAIAARSTPMSPTCPTRR